MPKGNIECRIINIYDKAENQRGKKELRTVDWMVDGKHYPQLEKREFFQTDQGWKNGKAKGFNAQDMAIVQKNWNQIMADLTGQPAQKMAEPVAAAASAPAPQEDF